MINSSMKKKAFNSRQIPIYKNSKNNQNIDYEEENEENGNDYNKEEEENEGEEEEDEGGEDDDGEEGEVEGEEEGEGDGEGEGELEEDDSNDIAHKIQIQRDEQNMDQLKDKKKKLSDKKNKKDKLKIESLRDSNFEIKKTQTEPVIEMQKAQSFEQPREHSKKSKTKNQKPFEFSQLKDCDVEI